MLHYFKAGQLVLLIWVFIVYWKKSLKIQLQFLLGMAVKKNNIIRKRKETNINNENTDPLDR